MRKFLQNVAGRFGHAKKPEVKHMARRAFDAGQISRLTASWGTSSNSINQDIYRNLRTLRARSRDLTYNNDYAKKFLQMTSTHVVGPTGFTLQVKAKENGVLDQVANTSIQDAFYRWAKRGMCDVTGKLSLCDIKHLSIKAVARDGEALVRKVYGKMNPFGFALQIVDIDRLDIERNEELSNGNIIKMGVEVTSYGRPVAYHLLTKHPGDSVYWTSQGSYYERVPAEDIYHFFIPDRPEQTRGLPWMHSAMMRLQNIGGYEEAAIIAARVGASKMGFFKSPDGDGEALADDVDESGNLITEADPGQFNVLPQGYDFTPFNPDYPHAMYGDFIKAALRGVAAGLGVAYNTLSNDLENVNFSSIRSGTLEERDNWMVIQNWFIESFLDDMFSTWLKYALLNGAIKLPTGLALPAAKFDKFNDASWIGRRWQWVDPRADVEANVTAINNRLKSRTQVISEMGGDIDDVWAQHKAEEEQAKAQGLVLPAPDVVKKETPPAAA
ncbi:MAG: phage portal protein [Alphaproteobacteria bacterium]|nr:phage portal protein [Alphaproteobacteria bacterium]